MAATKIIKANTVVVVVCGLNCDVYTLDEWIGEIRCAFTSGLSLISSLQDEDEDEECDDDYDYHEDHEYYEDDIYYEDNFLQTLL